MRNPDHARPDAATDDDRHYRRRRWVAAMTGRSTALDPRPPPLHPELALGSSSPQTHGDTDGDRPVILVIVALTLGIAALDFMTSATLIGSILFTFPLALCAMQRSTRLLWATASSVAFLTVLAGLWGVGRPADFDLWTDVANRALLLASLLTLTTLIHFWIAKSLGAERAAFEISHQNVSLTAQTGQLEHHVAEEIRMVASRQLVEEALRQSEESYRLVLDGIEDYAIFMVDPEGMVVSWNAGAQRIKGYAADEIIGKSFACFFSPEDRASGRPAELLRLTAASGRHHEQAWRIRQDGTRFLAGITFTALFGPSGELRGFSEFSHDLSESRAADARYRGLLEAAPDAMVVVDPSGEIVLLNLQAEQQFGYHRDELVGQQVTNIIPEGFAERLIADDLRSAADALAQQIGTGIELVARRKDGSTFPIEIMLSPLDSADGVLVTAAIRDISVRRAAEEHLGQTVAELQRSNDELGQFAYIASHDLQEPLRMVASYTQLLSRRYKGRLDADADEFIGFAVDGASRMQRLIEDLLAYSRVASKGSDLVEVSSEFALESALMNLSAAIEDRGAVVTHDPLPSVQADEVQLTQLFQNLIGNAIKYQAPGTPEVHISVASEGSAHWAFSVRDNGIGIDPQYFERIFGMFQRLHKRDEFGGTGMGLAICKKIVERHGGSLTVESILGHGSTFHFGLAANAGTT